MESKKNEDIGAMSVTEFCRRYGISRTHFYKYRDKPGELPVELEVGGRRLISFQAAREWQMRMEKGSPAVKGDGDAK